MEIDKNRRRDHKEKCLINTTRVVHAYFSLKEKFSYHAVSMFLCFLELLLSQKWNLTPDQWWRSGKVSFA